MAMPESSRDAARALHEAGFTISAAIVHQTDDLAGPTGYHRFLADSWRTFDLAALGKVADFLSVMSYDQHTRRTPPGPVDPSTTPVFTTLVAPTLEARCVGCHGPSRQAAKLRLDSP